MPVASASEPSLATCAKNTKTLVLIVVDILFPKEIIA